MKTKSVKLAGIAIVLALSLYHFGYSAMYAGNVGFVDFSIFLRQVENFQETGELYIHTENMEAYAPGTPVYKFPPLYAMLLLPVVKGGYGDGIYQLHWLLQLVVFLLTVAVIVVALAGRRPGWYALAAAALALNFEPFFETLFRLQIELPLLLLFTLCLLAFMRGRDGLAGAALALCAMLKIYPAFLLLYFCVKRRWAVVAWCMATMGLIQVAGLIVIGPEENYLFYFKILPVMLQEGAKVTLENIGIAKYPQLLLGATPATADALSRMLCLALLAASIFAVVRAERTGGEKAPIALEFALFVSLMLLFLPNSWAHYQLLLLLPLLVALKGCMAPERLRPAVLASVMLASLLLLFYFPCADASMPFPCAATPWFMGLFRFPRPFHDAMVNLRVLSGLLVWGASFALIILPRASTEGGRRRSPGADHSASHAP
jgi:hypothetical protein